MDTSEELKKIKKIYGEKFMHLCRTLFPTLLENEGMLTEILTSYFHSNCKTLYEDIISGNIEEEFKSYIYSKVDVEKPQMELIQKKTPYELLDESGYDLIECKTEAETQKFKKYYASGEELCTFNGGRLNRCVVFFAVKKDVENIKRKDFNSPKREDEYGTSVMGIQFDKEGLCTVSIKNRYNHKVNNPDATYGNNLDRIASGLTQSFSKLLAERGLKLNNSNIEDFEIPGYCVASDGKYYKYNMEIDGIYYCPGNIVIDNGKISALNENELLIDNFVIDIKSKTIHPWDPKNRDSFTDDLTDLSKIEIVKDKEKGDGTKTITIHKENQEQPITITVNKNNEIIGYKNISLKQVGDDFLAQNRALTELNLPALEQAGDGFLYFHNTLTELNLPALEQAGNNFLRYNRSLTELNLPALKQVGELFLQENRAITKLNLPSLEQAGKDFLKNNKAIIVANLPKESNLRKRFNDIIEKNRTIDIKEIAELDKKSNLTSSEIEQAAKNLNPIEAEKTEIRGDQDNET